MTLTEAQARYEKLARVHPSEPGKQEREHRMAKLNAVILRLRMEDENGREA